MKQLSFLKPQRSRVHGGALNSGKRKTARALSTKRPIHLVLKSKPANLFKNKVLILRLLSTQAKNKGLRLYSRSVQRDHVHILIKIPSRDLYKQFIRGVTGVLARVLGKGLWSVLPFTRIVEWGKDFRGVCRYVFQNEMEMLGVWDYQPRRSYRRYTGRPPSDRITLE